MDPKCNQLPADVKFYCVIYVNTQLIGSFQINNNYVG